MRDRCELSVIILSHFQVNFSLITDTFSCYEIRFYEFDLRQRGK